MISYNYIISYIFKAGGINGEMHGISADGDNVEPDFLGIDGLEVAIPAPKQRCQPKRALKRKVQMLPFRDHRTEDEHTTWSLFSY